MIAAPDSGGAAPGTKAPWRTAFVVIALILLSGGTRLYRIADWSFWSDEISTLRDANNLRDVIGYPVGYFLIGRAVKALGPTEFGARLLPALFGVAGVLALYLIGRRLFSERVGVISALLLSLCSYHVFYSQYARYYTMLGLFSLLGMWMAYEGLERNRRLWTAGGVFFLALACWTHWTAGLLIPALAVHVIWSARGDRPRGLTAWNLAILFLPFILGGALFSPHLLKFFAGWGGGAFSVKRAALMVLKLADRMEPAAILCAVPAAWLFVVTGDRRGKWLLAYALVPCAILVLFVGFAHGGSRFAFPALPAFMLLAGAGLDLLLRYAEGNRRKAAWALVGLACLSLAIRTGMYFGPEQGQRPRWKEATAYAVAQPDTPVVYATTPSIFNYYAERWHSDIRALPLDEAPTTVPADDRPRLLLVEMVSNVRPSPDELETIRSHYTLVEQYPLHVRLLDYGIGVYAGP